MLYTPRKKPQKKKLNILLKISGLVSGQVEFESRSIDFRADVLPPVSSLFFLLHPKFHPSGNPPDLS